MPIADFAKYPNVKVVNINATIPIVNVTPQLYGYRENVKMTISDILKCLMRRAIIHEVMPDGSTIRLDLKNFRDDNRAKMTPKEEEKKEEEVSTQELSQTAEQSAVFVTGMSVQTDEDPIIEPATETASSTSDEESETINLPTAESSEEPAEQSTATSTKSTSTRKSTKKKSTKK